MNIARTSASFPVGRNRNIMATKYLIIVNVNARVFKTVTALALCGWKCERVANASNCTTTATPVQCCEQIYQ